MLNAAVFVIGFIALGAAVLFVAMRGGPRGAREALHAQTARGRMAATAVVAGVGVVFGIGIPVAVLAANEGANREGPGGVRLTADQARGRQLFAYNCAACHTLKGAQATGRVGPNLDELRPPKGLVVNAIEMGRARGQGQMPAGLLTGQDAQDVASFVAAVAGR